MLNKDMLDLLKDFMPAVFATVKDGKPHLAFLSWLIATDEKTIKVALSKNSASVNNIKENANVAISVFGPSIAATIYGTAKIVKDEIETIPFPVSVVEVNVESVVDNLFPGATVKGTIPFEHTGKIQKALELDEKVLNALK